MGSEDVYKRQLSYRTVLDFVKFGLCGKVFRFAARMDNFLCHLLAWIFTGGKLAVSFHGSSGGDVFSSESVRRLSPVTNFGLFIWCTNAHLNRDL